MTRSIEIQRHNITLAEFLRYAKAQCAKKGMSLTFTKDEFENPYNSYNDHYFVRDGIKYVSVPNGPYQEWDGADAPCKSETYRVSPLNFQTYYLNWDGSCYNEICEFTYDDDKRGSGYYYQVNVEAEPQPDPEPDHNNMAGAIAEYAAIVNNIANDYDNHVSIDDIRADHPELNFMDNDEIITILRQAKKIRRQNERNAAPASRQVRIIRRTPCRNGIGASFPLIGKLNSGTYTIEQEKDGWGKLAGGSRWIPLANAQRI